MELKGPSEAEIKKFIRLEMEVEFVLLNSQHIKGQVLWADDNAFQVRMPNEKVITVLRPAVLYYSGVLSFNSLKNHEDNIEE